MKKFKFRLEAFRRLKEHIEKERQKELALASRRARDQETALSRIHRRHREYARQKRQRQAGKISVAEMLVYSRYLLKLKGDSLSGGELLKALREVERKKRDSLLEASRDRKIFDKLKERDQERFDRDARNILQKDADETGLSSFRRKKQHRH